MKKIEFTPFPTLTAEMQGKGIMRKAARAVIEYGFGGMDLDLVEVMPNPEHSRTVSLLEKMGFIRARVFEEADPSDGSILRMSAYILTRR